MRESRGILLIRALGPTLSSFSIPYGIISIANYIRKNSDYKVFVIDRYKDFWRGISYILNMLRNNNIKIVGISAMSSQKDDSLYLAREIKEYNKDVKVILGGIHFTVFPEDGLRYADAVVQGEGEQVFLDLAKGFLETAHDISGLYKGVSLTNLDEIGYPDMEMIREIIYNPGSEFVVMSSRGCPYECKFCLSREVRESRIRYHSIESLFDYLETLVTNFGVRNIYFTDDIFVLQKKRLLLFCEEFNKRGFFKYRINFSCFTHSGHGDLEIYSKLREIGFKRISIGVEFGDEGVLAINNKYQKLSEVEETVKMIAEAGIKPNSLFIIGGMGDTRHTIEKTIALGQHFKEKYGCSLFFSLAQPLPGSRFFHEAEKYGTIVDRNYSYYRIDRISFVPHGMTKQELFSLYIKARLLDKKNFIVYFKDSFRFYYLKILLLDFVLRFIMKKGGKEIKELEEKTRETRH